jgi:hypothetical protein
MTATPSPQDEEIIEILKRLETFKAEYPPELLAARRAAFIAQVEERRKVGVKEELPSEAQIIEILESLKTVTAEYPSELLAARRAAFIAQIEERSQVGENEELPSETPVLDGLESLKTAPAEYPPELLAARRAAFLARVKQQKEVVVKEELSSRARVIEVLENLKTVPAEYPPELLSARRAAFLAQIEQRNSVVEQAPVQNRRLITLFDRLKSLEIEYPLKLWVARRSAFLSQISRDSVSILDALRSAFQNILDQVKTPQAPMMKLVRSSLIIAGILVAAFVGSLLYENQSGKLFSPPLAQSDTSQPVAATNTAEATEVICKPGYLPPLCLAKEFDKAQDLTFQGNGSARPAVAKDTIPGYSGVHKAAYVNDGLYGAGSSWVSNSAYSWIKIDLGKPTTINTITFGRDRLGNFNDRNPGQFVIAVALSDNVYADGNSSNDFVEYTEVYDSATVGYDGIVSGSETIKASFVPTEARYVKITFENPGTAIDEVEAFMVQPPSLVYIPTQKPRDNQPRPTWTPIPTNTLVPTDTPVPPTDTPLPTDTPIPTDTPVPPTDTPVPPSDTPVPPTDTPVPPADTAEPINAPTETPMVIGP